MSDPLIIKFRNCGKILGSVYFHWSSCEQAFRESKRIIDYAYEKQFTTDDKKELGKFLLSLGYRIDSDDKEFIVNQLSLKNNDEISNGGIFALSDEIAQCQGFYKWLVTIDIGYDSIDFTEAFRKYSKEEFFNFLDENECMQNLVSMDSINEMKMEFEDFLQNYSWLVENSKNTFIYLIDEKIFLFRR